MNEKFVSDEEREGEVADIASEQKVSSALAPRAQDALAVRVEKEELRMVPSLAKEVAQNRMQAEHDAGRAGEAVRASMMAYEFTLDGMDPLAQVTDAFVERHPDLEADVLEMEHPLFAKLKGIPTLVLLTSLARHFKLPG